MTREDRPDSRSQPQPAANATGQLSTKTPADPTSKPAAPPAPPRLLAGGNPQIPKGDGEAPVAAYIAAVPGWKQAVVRRIDAIVTDAVPGVRKAVKWNSPLYGVEAGRWFLSLHCMTRYVKVAFFRGADLDPMPPEGSTQPGVRYLHVAENAPLCEARFRGWVRAAAALPGVKM